MRRLRWAICVSLALLPVACNDVGDNTGTGGGEDAGGQDSTLGAEAGLSDGTQPEGSSAEASAPDGTSESATGAEASGDDVGVDEGTFDGGADVEGPEAAGPEAAPPEAGSDSPVETGTSVEAGPDAMADAGPDAMVDAATDSSPGDSGHPDAADAAAAPTPCITSPCASSGPNSVLCDGNASLGVCTPTEAIFAQRDIDKGLLVNGQLEKGTLATSPNESCYAVPAGEPVSQRRPRRHGAGVRGRGGERTDAQQRERPAGLPRRPKLHAHPRVRDEQPRPPGLLLRQHGGVRVRHHGPGARPLRQRGDERPEHDHAGDGQHVLQQRRLAGGYGEHHLLVRLFQRLRELPAMMRRAASSVGWARGALAIACFAGAAAWSIPTFAATPLERYPWDSLDLASMRAYMPEAAEALEKGEELALAGKLDEALPLFQQAKTGSPESALPRRRICETLTALGRAAEALPACYAALQLQRTNIALRAIVRALVAGPGAPSMAQLDTALSLLIRERKVAGSHLMLSSALCDVAERIGDGVMLQHCADELLQIAPQAPETKRALGLLAARCPPIRFWTGWIALASAVLGTAAHALLRRRGRRALRRLPSALGIGGLLAGLLLTTASGAAAAGVPKPPGDWLSQWPISDSDPESSVPSEEQRNKDPLQFGYWLQDALVKGDIAWKKKDYASAVKYYRAVAKAVPDRAIAFRKMCDAYEALGDRDKAVASCLSAIAVEGVKYSDYARYVRLVLAKPTGLTKSEEDALATVLNGLKTDEKAHPLVDQLECEVGTRTANLAELEECTAGLLAKAPGDPGLLRFQFALALRKGDLAEARRLADQAKQAGEASEGIQGMDRALALATRRHTRTVVLKLGGGGVLVIGLGLAVLYLVRRRAAPAVQPA